jgi:hypothetical protein
MVDGHCEMSRAPRLDKALAVSSHSGMVVVLAGSKGRQKEAQTGFLKERYSLTAGTIDDLISGRLSSPAGRGFVLEDYPRTRERTEHLAALVKQASLRPPIVIDIEDRGAKTVRLNPDVMRAFWRDADTCTVDGTRPIEEVSETLRRLPDRIEPW